VNQSTQLGYTGHTKRRRDWTVVYCPGHRRYMTTGNNWPSSSRHLVWTERTEQ